MKNQVQIKRRTTSEDNVSLREVWYELYVDGEFVKSFDDVCDAMDAKEEAEKE